MTHNTQPVTKEALVEEFRNKVLGVESAVRMYYKQEYADELIEKMMNLFSSALDRYGTEQRAEGAEELATIMRDGGCVCGENRTVGVVHRKYAPCYWHTPTNTPLPDNKD